MNYNAKDKERNENISFISEAIFKQTKMVEKQNYEISKVCTQVENISYSMKQILKEAKTLFIDNMFAGLHLTMNKEPIFIPVDKIVYISGNQILMTNGETVIVDQSHEAIMEKISVSC